MSKSNTFENDFLKLIFHGTSITGIARNAVSDPYTSLWVSLHTADPGEGGDQTSNEAAYGSYGRKQVARTTSGWTVTDNNVKPVNDIIFATCTSGSATITHFGVGVFFSSFGKLLYYGSISPSISVSTGIIPVLSAGTSITED